MTNYTVETVLDAATKKIPEAGEAEWDVADWPHQIIATNGAEEEIFCICSDKMYAEHIMNLLNANPYSGPQKIV